jgi:four helix bundle protein
MATFRRFEDIEAWQKARSLAKAIYAISRRGGLGKDFALRDQIRRARVSVMSNIAEGFERSSDREFARFLTIAKGSAGEVKSQLYVAYDQGYLDENGFNELVKEVDETARKIGSLISYLRAPGSRKTGTKA